jgi:hypothetical protein
MKKELLYYLVLFFFAVTLLVTLLGVIGVIVIKDKYLDVLFGTVLVELCVSAIGLFKATDWFDRKSELQNLLIKEKFWWQFQQTDRLNKLSFFKLNVKSNGNTINFDGTAFNENGVIVAKWWSIASGFSASTEELFYLWTGDHANASEDFSGIGICRFTKDPKKKRYNEGTGWYTSGNILAGIADEKVKVNLRAATADETRIMLSNDENAKCGLISDLVEKNKVSYL